MKIVKRFPPNIKQIRENLTPQPQAVFAWGETIYNPSGNEIRADILYHESIHFRQMKEYPSPEIWWTEYLTNPAFRLKMEVEAYFEQSQFVKRYATNKVVKELLDEIAEHLEKYYNVGISKYQALTLIRNYETQKTS